MPNSTLNYHTTLSNRKKRKRKKKRKRRLLWQFWGRGK